MKTALYIWKSSKWPEFTWDAASLLALLSECRLRQAKLLTRISSLGFNYQQQAHTDILLEEALTTSA
ncbi:MAG: DUF4172 domain-containing protein, partial [Proteobacteria bacterium]|nr:DUF4172 domain-containing protein [Pseudomonadota bacterium]